MRVMTRVDTKVLVAALFVVPCFAGCGGKTLGTNPAATDSVITPDVVSASFQSLSAGYSQPIPSGTACDPGQWTYAITLATHDVTWTGCDVNGGWGDPNSYTPATVDHAVDPIDWATVSVALAEVTLSAGTSCGEDKNAEVLTVQTATDSTTYGDDFYACLKQYPGYVKSAGLDNLYATLSTLP
jgi:hypothetical protein